ncbi:hypothetical protein LWI28_025412 [Acer negundo]|uniref:Protein BZR1 homolog n=1 Tax=Acer negundo TaxID=4023 RepID=A0AAD5JGB8_ACENE|nr:hypothetical protein LWI28_025412 [Acer negundo]KAK4857435.1 hypothetical protein QYF36_000664 [Acer negundo]
MKEGVTAAVGRSSSSGGGVRSENDKERTKLRERQRRAITTKIFHGLRKWGGYHLSPRADINEVLRELAREAGWVIEPDGTTYRATLSMNPCPVCGVATPTTSSSIVMGGGDCSTTASPRCVSVSHGGDPNISGINITGGSTTTTSPSFSADNPLALYLYGGLPSGPCPHPTTTTTTTTSAQQQFYLREMRASNQNTPAASPLRRPL